MMTARLFSLSLLSVLMISTAPASAAVDPAGADAVKKLVANYLDNQKNTINADGDMTMVTKGDITVKPAGDYYATTLPHISIQYDDGSVFEIGTITANITPGDAPNLWKMTWALPQPMTMIGANKKPEARVTFDDQALSGVWHSDINTFVQLNAQYKNIVTTVYDEKNAPDVTVTLPEARFGINLKQGANGNWSGPSHYTASNITVESPQEPGFVKIGKIDAIGEITDFSPAMAKDFEDKISAMSESMATTGAVPSAGHVQGMYDLVLTYIGNICDSMSTQFSVHDFQVNAPAKGEEPAQKFGLKTISAAFGMKGFRSNDVSLNMALDYNGFTAEPKLDQAETIPTESRVDITIKKVPYNELTELGRSTLKSSMTGGAGAELAGLQALMLIPQLLTNAGTSVNIKDTTFGNDLYGLKMNGDVIANMQSVLSATGKARIEVAGMDKLIAEVKKQSETATDPAVKKQAGEVLAGLTMLQMVGQQQPGTDAKGRAVRTYDIELTKEGQMLMNGTDMTTLPSLMKQP
ncbi:hypothetical protein [Micavibrio aeruginosavorus]|uniref:hypothetical protein n=1 Tax=Micavibrio aeruginosavorus TaxID=349221 RepID=UPI003F4ABDBE